MFIVIKWEYLNKLASVSVFFIGGIPVYIDFDDETIKPKLW